MKKNQVIITSLAILIAVAGYLNFADVDLGFQDKETSTDSSSILDQVEYDLTDETALLDENGAVSYTHLDVYKRQTLDKVKYSTSNKKVATVNSRGLIVAKSAGRATITVTAGSKKAKIVVTVPKVKTTEIKGVKTDLTLKRGKTYRIKAKAYPTNTDEKITYTSSNKKLATVTSKGVIKAVKKGKVTITVKSGRKTVKMQLTVK